MIASFTPKSLNFGGVPPGLGPSILVDPSLGPPAISFNGGVQIKDVPADATVTFSVTGDTSHFRVRDVTVMQWELEPIDGGELPPGHHGPPPKVKVLEIVDQSTGASPVAVIKEQVLLVRVEYTAPAVDGTFTGTLVIQGSTWEPIQVPLSFFVAQVQTRFNGTPFALPRGTAVQLSMAVTVLFGPDIDVTYQLSPTQLSSGVTVLPAIVHARHVPESAVLPVQVALDAPLGDNTLAINQFDWQRTGILVPVTITADPQPNQASLEIARKASERQDVLGGPTSGIFSLQKPDGSPLVDCFEQNFERGAIYYSPKTGANEVHGDILQKYNALGGPTGELGFPITDGNIMVDLVGTVSNFEAGSIYSHPQIGPRMVRGDIENLWLSEGGIHTLGYPVRDEHHLLTGQHVDDPDLNTPAIWSTFENGVIAQSQRGIKDALPASVVPDKVTVFIRKQFDDRLKQEDSDLGLDPGVETIKVLNWEYDLAQSTGRGLLIRLTGFHHNPVIADTTFSLTLGLRIGFKLGETPLDPDKRTLLVALVPGSLSVEADGAGADEAKQRLTAGIQKVFADPVAIAEIPVLAQVLGITVWAAVDLMITQDGTLLLLVNPSPSNALGSVIQSAAQSLLDQTFG
jgi:hypothetical protein